MKTFKAIITGFVGLCSIGTMVSLIVVIFEDIGHKTSFPVSLMFETPFYLQLILSCIVTGSICWLIWRAKTLWMSLLLCLLAGALFCGYFYLVSYSVIAELEAMTEELDVGE